MGPIFRSVSRFVGVVVLIGTVPVTAAAQTPSESELLARVASQPANVNPLLDLAKLYAEQRRLDEAIAMTQRAGALLLQQQAARGTRTLINGAVFTPVQVTPVQPASGVNAVSAPEQGMRVRVGGDIREPRKIYDVKPTYPDAALSARVQGIVIIEAVIGTTGTVTDASVLRGVPLLDDAALEAVRQWRFTPTLLNGVPVEVVMTVTVNFTLAGTSSNR